MSTGQETEIQLVETGSEDDDDVIEERSDIQEYIFFKSPLSSFLFFIPAHVGSHEGYNKSRMQLENVASFRLVLTWPMNAYF